MQINRLFEIVYILLSKGKVTAKELAKRFEVSQRTIYRDIDALSIAGVPVYTEKGKGGGINLLPEFKLDQSILTDQEQGEIISSLQALKAVNPKETTQTLLKLSAIFNKKAVHWIDIDFSDWSHENSDLFRNIKTAILAKKIVSFEYYSTKGEQTSRNVEPVQLLFKHRAWYLRGFCHFREDLRIFKLTRIQNLSITDKHFTARDIRADLSALSEPPNEKDFKWVELKLKIAPEMAYRVYDEFRPQDIDQLPDGSFIATAVYPEDEWVYGNIMSYGEYIEVLEPMYIREHIQTKLEKTLNNY